MIQYQQGDVLKSNAFVISHGCNCRGGFGAGIAYQIAKKYPHVREAYLAKYRETDSWKLGDVQFVPLDDTKTSFIANCATQDTYRGPGVHFNEQAFKTCMEKVKQFANGKSIAMPKIGAGLARGNWERIEVILNQVFDANDHVTVYVLE